MCANKVTDMRTALLTEPAAGSTSSNACKEASR
jgi:hypothetical protein